MNRKRPSFQRSLTDRKAEAFAAAVDAELSEIREMLLEKNRKYGDSALNPVRIFSRAAPDAQIAVRLDDKLSRIRSAQGDDREDAEKDAIGYMVLQRIARKRKARGR